MDKKQVKLTKVTKVWP